MSSILGGKAIRLASSGGVQEITHARVFQVPSSTGVPHMVVLGLSRPVCTCEAGRHGRPCSHVRAAQLVAREGAG